MRWVHVLLASLFMSACGGSYTRSMGSGDIQSGATLIPPMPPHVTSYQRWQHVCVSGGSTEEELSAALSEAGEKGWEMVSFAMGEYGRYVPCFKRPQPAPATAPPAASSATP